MENKNEEQLGINDYLDMLPTKGQKIVREHIEELKKQADMDFSTEVLNRRGFNGQIENIAEQIKIGEVKQVAMIFGDIDKFKVINDDLGHAFGDKLLRSIADVLRVHDVVGRLGGDEFGILLPVLSSKESFSDDVLEERIDHIKVSVETMIEGLKKDLPEGVEWPIVDGKMAGTVSFGGKMFTDKEFLQRVKRDGDVVARLMKEADKRMYEDKSRRED